MIVDLENQPNPNWSDIFIQCEDTIDFIIHNNMESVIDNYFIKYLDDADIRAKDEKYANYQRQKILNIMKHS
jgi:hypothetical protein